MSVESGKYVDIPIRELIGSLARQLEIEIADRRHGFRNALKDMC